MNESDTVKKETNPYAIYNLPLIVNISPNGGPQKQGNRLAGIRRTKGEH